MKTSEIILLCIVGAFGIGLLAGWFKAWYDITFKKNCFKCKYYYLYDVASAGDCSWYKCKKCKEIHDRHSGNTYYRFRKCKEFEEE